MKIEGITRTLDEEKAMLDKALDEFTNDCRARLHEMARRGKRGWDAPHCVKDIARDMHEDAKRAALNGNVYHLHDIANRAMMLWWQAWRGSNSVLRGEPCPALENKSHEVHLETCASDEEQAGRRLDGEDGKRNLIYWWMCRWTTTFC